MRIKIKVEGFEGKEKLESFGYQFEGGQAELAMISKFIYMELGHLNKEQAHGLAMAAQPKAYLSEIGRKGGQKSKRTLTSEDARAMRAARAKKEKSKR